MSWRISTGGLQLTIDCRSAASLAAVRAHFSPWFGHEPSAHRAPRELAVRVRGEGAGFVVDDGASVLARARDERDLLYFLQRLLDAEIARLVDRTPIHAGVVEVDGCAVLLPGASGSGKTTLVAALMAQGARYLSDEYALLDDRGWVHPYPRPLPPSTSGRAPWPPAGPPDPFAARAVGCILELRFVEGGELCWRRVAASDAALVLLRNTPQHLGESSALTSRILRAVAPARAFVGVRGEAAAAAASVLAAVRDAAG